MGKSSHSLLNKLSNTGRTRNASEKAVALVNEQGYSVQKAADSPGIRSNILYRWKNQPDAEKAGKVLSEDERAVFKRLRKENKDLRAEVITVEELHLYRRAKALFKASRQSLGSRELAKKLR